MKKNKIVKRLAICLAAMAATTFVACEKAPSSGGSGNTPLTATQWSELFTQIESSEKLAAAITYSYSVPSDDLTTAWTVKMDGNVRYQKEVIGRDKYVYEGYSVYDDDTMTMVNYRLDGASSKWTKRINTYTEANYEADKESGDVLHSIGFYYVGYCLQEGDPTQYALIDLFSAFTYQEDSGCYTATLYIFDDDNQEQPTYRETKFTCKFVGRKLVQMINEYEYDGVTSITTVNLTEGESLSVPQSVVEGATEASGGKK